MIRVAQIFNHMNSGGVEAVVMNYYRHIDRSKVQFDFIVSGDSKIPHREEIESLGGRVFLLPKIVYRFLQNVALIAKVVADFAKDAHIA